MGTMTSREEAARPQNNLDATQFFTEEQLAAMFRGYPPQIPTAPPPVVHTARTVRNDVNLKRETLAIRTQSSRGIVTFSIDTAKPCTVTLYLCVTETVNHANFTTKLKPKRREGVTRQVAFPVGTGQRFVQSEHKDEGLDLSGYSDAELKYDDAHPDRYPLVVLLEANDALSHEATVGATEFSDSSGVQSQLTYATLQRNSDGGFSVKVLKQKIQVHNQAYELRAIYGIEQAGTEDGGDCVVCLSAPKNTTVLPCRHLCLCRDCADQLRLQTNKCPICRTNVESLLKIDLGSKELAAGSGGGSGAAAAATATADDGEDDGAGAGVGAGIGDSSAVAGSGSGAGVGAGIV